MERLGIALILAMCCHVVLFLMILPARQNLPPVVKGRQQVRVRIAGQVPFPEPVVQEVANREKIDTEDITEVLETPEVESAIEAEPQKREAAEALPEVRPRLVKQEIQVETPVQKEEPPPAAGRLTGEVPESAAGAPPATQKNVVADDGGTAAGEPDVIGEPMPLVRDNIQPKYPSLARKRGWEGTVMLKVDVKADGEVEKVYIEKSSSYSLLDDAARDAVQRWHFAPGTKNGRPVAMQVHIPVNFVLQDQR